LSIVKGLVRLHGGDLDIRSRVGEGTRVSVRLPIDCERGRMSRARSLPVPIAMPHLAGQSPQKSAARSAHPVVMSSPESMTVKKSA
jgi:cell cycle sensor histidine kinase DivJ